MVEGMRRWGGEGGGEGDGGTRGKDPPDGRIGKLCRLIQKFFNFFKDRLLGISLAGELSKPI